MPSVFAGTEIDAFTAVSAYSMANLITGFTRAAPRGTTGFLEAAGWSANLAAGWARVGFDGDTWSAGRTALLLTGGGVNILRVQITATNVAQLQRWDGAAWQTVPGSFTRAVTTQIFSLEWSIGAAGRFAFYVDGLEIAEFVGDTRISGVTAADKLRLSGPASGFTYFYEVIVADEDCREWRLKTLAPTGPGTYTEQSSGSWADVDETTPSDADLVSLATAGNRFSVAVTDVASIASGMVVESVHVHARARNDGSGPLSLDLGVRGGGSDAYAASQALTGGYATVKARFSTRPGSGSPPTLAEMDSYEIITRAAT